MLIWLVERSFGLISTDLWGGRTDLHFKGVFISPFLSFDWSIWKYCGVVGLICNLREFLWGGPTDLHFKGVFSSPFLSFWLVNLKLLTIPIGSFFGLIRTYSRLGISVLENCEIHAKQSLIFPYMKVFHGWENYFTMSSIYMYAADFTRRFNGL